ncbi:hypothetical protein [Leuconostoc pseudomesenteroides]|uniref:hypothetical protein n=1 Tax=Leuconostoc pseudomesenteroides TaxID=33968 RepID=UPI0032DE5B9A
MTKENTSIISECGLDKNKYTVIEKLGEGANGKAYLIRNEILQKKFVLKMYLSNLNEQQVLEEIRKNSIQHGFNSRTVVFDAGTTENGYYSMMGFAQDFISLRNWLSIEEEKDSSTHDEEPRTTVFEHGLAQNITVSLNILAKVANKNHENIIHGDLHPNNILIDESYTVSNNSSIRSKGEFNHFYFDKTSYRNVGEIQFVDLELIDMGQTKYNKPLSKQTAFETRLRREHKLIFQTVAEVMDQTLGKFNFHFRDLFLLNKNIEFQFSAEINDMINQKNFGPRDKYFLNWNKKEVDHKDLTTEMMRVILMLNHMLGLSSASPECRELTYEDIIILQDLMNEFLTEGEKTISPVVDNRLVSDIEKAFQEQKQRLIEIMDHKSESAHRFRYVNWPKLFLLLSKLFKNTDIDQYKLVLSAGYGFQMMKD